jgi:hypothetical protein
VRDFSLAILFFSLFKTMDYVNIKVYLSPENSPEMYKDKPREVIDLTTSKPKDIDLDKILDDVEENEPILFDGHDTIEDVLSATNKDLTNAVALLQRLQDRVEYLEELIKQQ